MPTGCFYPIGPAIFTCGTGRTILGFLDDKTRRIEEIRPGSVDEDQGGRLRSRFIASAGAEGAEVKYHDPHVRELTFDGSAYESQPLPEAIASCDCVVIVTNHSSLDIRTVVEEAELVIDTRNATRGTHAEKNRKL